MQAAAAAIGEAVDDGLGGGVVLEQQVGEILQGQVVEAEAAAPGFRERRLHQHHIRQQHRQGQDEQRVAQHDPAPGAELHDPPLAALAGQGDEARAGGPVCVAAEHHTVISSSGTA